MFISTVDGDAFMGGMSLGLKKSEWNEICRGFAGNFFYIYNKINPKYPANTISIYGDISGIATLLYIIHRYKIWTILSIKV